MLSILLASLLIGGIVEATASLKGDRVLVIGGTYFLGERTVETLVSHGKAVTVLNRGSQVEALKRLKALGVTHLNGDRNDRAFLQRTFENHEFDAIVDMVMYHPQQLDMLVDALRIGKRMGHEDQPRSCCQWHVSHYIFISSTSQYEACEDEHYQLFGKGAMSNITEADFTPNGCNNKGVRPYSQNKHAVHVELSRLWKNEGFSYTSLLIPGMSGPNAKDGGNPDLRHLVYQLVATAAPSSSWTLKLHKAAANRPVRITAHCQHVADAVAATLARRAFAIGKHFHILMKEAITLEDYLRAIADAYSPVAKFPRIEYVQDDHAFAGPFYGRALSTRWGPLSIQKAQDELSWEPLPIEDWMPETVQWWSRHIRQHFTEVKGMLPEIVVKYWSEQLHEPPRAQTSHQEL